MYHEKTKDFFTGLIIDATGINVTPSMVPVVLDENGRKVFGPAFMSRESAVQYGTSEYEKEIERAKQNPRVGNNPLIIKGLRTDGSENTNIIISNSDALVLRSKPEHLAFLKKCQVIIVIDELKKQPNKNKDKMS
jgi:FMN phosphatase YigB (HAD superfamily)